MFVQASAPWIALLLRHELKLPRSITWMIFCTVSDSLIARRLPTTAHDTLGFLQFTPAYIREDMIDERSRPAFEQLSDSNRGPLIIVTAYIFLLSSFPALLVKIWTRASTARKLIHTDWLMLVGYVCSIVK